LELLAIRYSEPARFSLIGIIAQNGARGDAAIVLSGCFLGNGSRNIIVQKSVGIPTFLFERENEY
jgi:hypothetical protein